MGKRSKEGRNAKCGAHISTEDMKVHNFHICGEDPHRDGKHKCSNERCGYEW